MPGPVRDGAAGDAPGADGDLVAGADDKIFRVDRAEASECAELVTDRKELAALRKQRLAGLRRE